MVVKTPGWSPTSGVGFGGLSLTEIQRSEALGGSIAEVLWAFSRSFGGSGGPLVLLNLFPQPYYEFRAISLHRLGVSIAPRECLGHP